MKVKHSSSSIGSMLRTQIFLSALALLVGLTYWNGLANEFVFDDRGVILDNQLISRLDNLPVVFVSGYWDGVETKGMLAYADSLYRPLVIASYVLNHAAGGWSPFGYHVVNVILHILVTWLVFGIALQLRLGAWAAVASAALFAVHPIHVEAVTYIVGRAELMMAAGVLGSLWLAGRGQRVLSATAFAIGLFSKEQAIVLPLLVLLYDWSLKHTVPIGSPRLVLGRYGVYLLPLVVYLGLRLYVLDGKILQNPGILENPAAHGDWWAQVLTAIKVAGMYVWLFVWPASLAADYSLNAIPLSTSLFEPGVLAGLAAWLGLLGLAGWSFKFRARPLAFCTGLTLLSFLPASNVLIAIGTIMGERLFYLPSVGLCLLVGVIYERGIQALEHRTSYGARKIAVLASHMAVVGICVALSVRTLVRNRDWINNETVLRRTVEVVPNNAKAHAMLGHSLFGTSGVSADGQAIEAYRTALAIYPDYFHRDSGVIGNLSALLLKSGKSEEARELLERTITADPEWGVLHHFLALHYARTGSPARAESEWQKAISLNPNIELFRSSYSRFLIEAGRFEEGLALADAVLRDHPGFLLAVFNRALALQGLARFTEALAEYKRVLAMPVAPPAAKQDAERNIQDIQARLEPSHSDARDCLPGLAGC